MLAVIAEHIHLRDSFPFLTICFGRQLSFPWLTCTRKLLDRRSASCSLPDVVNITTPKCLPREAISHRPLPEDNGMSYLFAFLKLELPRVIGCKARVQQIITG